ncbi:hypothetical protein L596_018678 [Steinernema carpocapsae]|uniref:Uncharacterized protein n=1 Tax=Steinernema carpocapsae TaxID=34508 RepID=A0A4V6XW48_STECR|nr:hypothetical protein L596_018678 [Steinernema carpocapsae]
MHGDLGPARAEHFMSGCSCWCFIERLLEDQNSNELWCALLWADPMHNSSGFNGEDVVMKLCDKLKIDMIARSCQVMQNGYSFFCQRTPSSPLPTTIPTKGTSAP